MSISDPVVTKRLRIPVEHLHKAVHLDGWPVVSPVPKKGLDEWVIADDWHYTTPQGLDIVIPKGFVFNGASIPRPFWLFCTPAGDLFIPSIPHDFGYRHGYVLLSSGEKPHKSRWFFDDLFLHLARTISGRPKLGQAAFLAIRAFGWMAWKGG